MTWGLIEREIRLLPQVLACAVSDDEVVVLLAPGAEPAEVESRIAAILDRWKAPHGIRLLETAPRGVVAGAPIRTRAWRSPAVLVGSLIATAALAASSLVAGIGMRGDGPTLRRPVPVIAGPEPSASIPPPVVPPPVDPPAPEPQAEPEAEPEPQPSVVLVRNVTPEPPAPRAPFTDVPALDRAPPPATTARPPSEPEPEPAADPQQATCHEPAARRAPREVPGRSNGNGPPPWSHSVLNEPHCERGRPK